MKSVVDKLFHSIVFKIGAMMFCISFVAIISMFSSVFISEMADKDALAINHAGSLRMQSYKILSDFERKQLLPEELVSSHIALLNDDLAEFEKKINAPVLAQPVSMDSDSVIGNTLTDIKANWYQSILPKLTRLVEADTVSLPELYTLKSEIDTFVLELDHLVSLYQQHAEDRILLIRMIQGISLFITVILVVIIMFQLNRRVEKPLSELTFSAKQIIAGDYTAQTHIMQNDELGFLSRTMNQMADAIAESHLQLEKRVKSKTAELRQSKDSLELLYETSTYLSRPSDSLDLEPIINKLSKISGLHDLDLCLMTSEGQTPYEHILTANRSLTENCQTGDCSGCISEAVTCSTNMQKDNKLSIRYPLLKGNKNYGVLVCNLPEGNSLAGWQHQLLQSITAQIATGLKLRQQSDQNRRFALVNERSVIARELHDSLAQALSYLKIQVTRLQKMQKVNASQEQVDGVVDELKTGLNSAYRQLRELLTTFRLKMDSQGLQATFEDTIKQLNERADGKTAFSLDYQIGDLPLTPNEEIHIMQIAREATQNVLHHAKASVAKVSVFSSADKNIHLVVEDNGIGLPDAPEKLNHYGLAIMQERSSHLGGELTLTPCEPTGTRIELIHKPAYLLAQSA